MKGKDKKNEISNFTPTDKGRKQDGGAYLCSQVRSLEETKSNGRVESLIVISTGMDK